MDQYEKRARLGNPMPFSGDPRTQNPVKLKRHTDEDGKPCHVWTCPKCGQKNAEHLDEQSQVLCEKCDTYFDFDESESGY